MKLRPFFSYFGSKWRATARYSEPKYNLIIEPFAGSAGYSLNYSDRQIKLYDLDPVICGLWEYLIKTTEYEIMHLPSWVEDVRYLPGTVCQEAKWLIGFHLNRVSTRPRNQVTRWSYENETTTAYWNQRTQVLIANQLKHIRHWKVFNKSYKYIDNQTATWFVDPPYQKDYGKFYIKNVIDYNHLGVFCRERLGQVIVCENAGADWLPFKPFKIINTVQRYKGAISYEVVWTNER